MFRRTSQLLTVDITFGERPRHLILPLPLFIIDDLLEGWWFWGFVLRGVMKRADVKVSLPGGVDAAALSKLGSRALQRLWYDLRRQGCFELMDIKSEEFSLIVKFY